MSFPNPRVVLSSAVFRIAIFCLCGFVAAVITIGVLAGVIGREGARADALAEADELKTEVFAAFDAGGVDAAREVVASFGDEYVEDGSFLSLRRAADGSLIAGVDAPSTSPGETFFYVPEGWDEDEAAHAATFALDDDALLTVGVSFEAIYDVEEAMITGFAALFLIGLPLTLLTGFILSALVIQRLQYLQIGAQRIGEGRLDHRLGISARNDEFDRLGAALNGMAWSLQASYRNVRNVSDGVAHNLRTPLTRLRQRLSDAMEEVEASEKASGALAAADAAANDLVGMFEALLRIGEIEAGQRRAAFKRISLSESAAEIVDSFNPVAEDTGGMVRGEIAPDCFIEGDGDLIKQLLANLVENAIEHGGGDVVV
ncbi:MAG: HAMP domain-containing protein, partial [Pseudomonadota bacterium]